MATDVELRVSELLTARLCHELAGPITALANGIDLLCEPGSDLDGETLALVGDSMRRSSLRLQFYRFAYGFSGSSWSGMPVSELAAGYFEGSRVECDSIAALDRLPLPQQKLGCNLLVSGAEALGRGGRLTLTQVGSTQAGFGLRVEAAGEGVSFAREQFEALTLSTLIEDLGPRTVHGFFTGLLAKAQGWRLAAEITAPGRLYLATVPSKP